VRPPLLTGRLPREEAHSGSAAWSARLLYGPVGSAAKDERLPRYAELAVRAGANEQPGQEVFLNTAVEHHDLARALTRHAYKAGASYVHVLYRDGHARRAMIELGPDEALTYSPEWRKTVIRSWAGNAMIGTTGDPEPD